MEETYTHNMPLSMPQSDFNGFQYQPAFKSLLGVADSYLMNDVGSAIESGSYSSVPKLDHRPSLGEQLYAVDDYNMEDNGLNSDSPGLSFVPAASI